jgi:hypothetical protein
LRLVLAQLPELLPELLPVLVLVLQPRELQMDQDLYMGLVQVH